MNILLYDFLNSYILHDLIYFLQKQRHNCNFYAYPCHHIVDKNSHSLAASTLPMLFYNYYHERIDSNQLQAILWRV